MRYPCRIILPNGKIEKTEFSGDHLVMRRKVQFEHAPNVVSALAADIMRSTPYFVRFFKDEPLLCTDLATVEPMFDGFVHGTQSSMLIMLEKSGYVLESPVGLLRKQCTTLTGELYPGYSRNSLDSSPMMCFGKLHQWRGYNLEDVIKGYTARELTKSTMEQHQQNATEKFHHYLAQARKDSYSSINPLLLYYARARYLGVSDEKLIPAEDLCKEYKAAVDVYYLLLLIAEHLEVDKDHDRQYGPAYKLAVKRFDFGLLVQRILFLQLDIKAIYENPTSENLGKLLALFPVLNCPDNPEASFVKVLEKPRDCSTFEDGHDFENVTVYDGFSARINHFFCGFHKENCFTGYIGCKKHIPLMEAHLTMVRRLTQAKPENLFDNPFNKDLLLRNFPLVLVSENAEAMQIMNSKEGKEYRAKRALRFGVDITMVATDTRENALTLKQWLNQHDFTHVTVVLCHELEQVKDTCRRPTAYYQHFDGFPRLSWLAATQVKPEAKQQLIALRDQGQQELETFSNSPQGTMEEGEALVKKVESVSSLCDQVQLIEDAERYKSSNSIQ